MALTWWIIDARKYDLPHEGAPKTEWRVDVASHRVLTPSIVFAVIANALKSTAGDLTDVIFHARTKIGIEGHGVISLEERNPMLAKARERLESCDPRRVFLRGEAARCPKCGHYDTRIRKRKVTHHAPF